jgi:DNA (cytosine-5)-methyltransferase 1
VREDSDDPHTVPSVPQPLRMIDLFAGCGGLTSGFTSTGRFTPVAAVEKDLAAAATYAANFGEDHIHRGDIEDWATGRLPAADVVVGGPPCQGFSNLGKRRASDPLNELWRHYMAVLLAVRPKAFLLENVDRFGTSEQFRDLERETQRGGLLQNYAIRTRTVRATDFGSAQLRRRFIVIGTRRDLDTIEVPTGSVAEKDWRTVRQALEGLAKDIDPDDRDLPAATTEYFGKVVAGVYKSPDLHVARFYKPQSLERFTYIPKGGNRLNLPDRLKAPCWLGHDKGALDVMGRMHWDRPSVTIRTEFYKPEKGRYLHPDRDRVITHHEAARLQGFADEFQWCGIKYMIARQIGNAVPVELARGLAEHIAGRLS